MTVRTTRQRGSKTAAPWTRAGLRIGLLVSLQVPVGVLLIKLIPSLWAAYPLLLLPLLLAGPLASRRRRLRNAIAASAIAGIVSGTVAAGSLILAWWLFGDWFWMMTSAAGAPPMPALPRISVLPMEYVSWAQQDILFFQPLLAVLLGVATWSLGPLGRKLNPVMDRLLPDSLSARLRLAFGTLTVLTLALGMIGFGMIEEMHVRTHRVQLRADWQRQLGVVRATLDEDLALYLRGISPSGEATWPARTERVDQIFRALASTGQRPGLSARPEDVVSTLNSYRPAFDQAVAAHHAYGEVRSDPAREGAALADAISAVGALQRIVEADLTDMLASSDLTHHQRLILVMALVGIIAGLGIWTGERVLQAIGMPLAVLGAHLRRVARGDFSRRVPTGGPYELGHLGESVNQMTTDLARLYESERERRATAEEIATHERELSAAKEFWTNTLVHDLKNPLAMIVGWSDILEYGHDEDLTTGQAEAIQHIRQAAGTLEDLVADINDSFRLQAAALPIHRTSVRPGELLWTAVSEYRGLDRTAPDVRIASGLAPVLADTRLVGRVLHNLIGNAYKHGGSDARVGVVAEQADGTICFAVDDDGPGIPAGERERVFERFIQGASVAHGSGLGLAFCKLVVEQLGGRIWADVSPLGGTRIAFELPAAPVEVPARTTQDTRSALASRVA
jgi:signal transduction histidine kinase